MFRTTGIIQYYNNWVMAWVVEDDLLEYYRALLPKALGVCPPMRPAHVSIVRLFESPDRRRWKEFDEQSIVVEYEPGIQTDGLYYWLDAWSDEVGAVRRSLGLPTFRERDGFSDYGCYHITVANNKCDAKLNV